MIKFLKKCNLFSDGTVFKYLALIPESVMLTGAGRIKLHNWKGLLRYSVQYRKLKLTDDLPYVLIHNSFSGYYHWLLESLPRLLEAQKHLATFILLLPDSYTDSFYRETLTLMGIRHVYRMQDKIKYEVPELALPYLVEAMGYHSSSVLQELKQTILNAVKPKSFKTKRIYVSRQKATRRKVRNDREVEQLLVKYGFEIVCFEDYTIQEVVQLCANAEMLVGIHGAGLANILFIPEGAVVIELRKFDNGKNIFFESLAGALQLHFLLLYCKAVDENQSVQDADLYVDVKALESVIGQHLLLPVSK
jgi:capsular polysaccharide biosynthesis protein